VHSRTQNGNSGPSFESWGRYPRLHADFVPLHWKTDFPLSSSPGTAMLPVGLGRSYGDVCLLDGGTLLGSSGLSRLIAFDSTTGVLRCEAGVSLADVLEFAVPRGWFLSTTPGTKYVTIGGAIANDIHGKNHHVAGTFGCHVPRLELVRSDGTRIECSPTENPDWFRATIGGLGLTGLISWADIQLRPIISRKICYEGIRFVGIDQFLAISRESAAIEYSVAWIDCVAQGRNFARGIFMRGSHSTQPEELRPSPASRLSVPVEMPAGLLNHFTVGAFNSLYYHKQLSARKTSLVDYESFFYPLDSIHHWNRIYGPKGLLQFQCVLPESDSAEMNRLLRAITASGLASFLAVIKVFGDVKSPGILSFPRPGITLALDFPVSESSFDLLNRLGAITLEHGGRMYPAKDAMMTPEQFQTFYPEWEHFAQYVDPAFSSAFWRRVTANA
jgi:FAD/FMN-containing dehydrogenase